MSNSRFKQIWLSSLAILKTSATRAHCQRMPPMNFALEYWGIDTRANRKLRHEQAE
ncbi:MAG: hypothetical protein KDB11_33570 [Planctomycetales bacterium]|nr:hypothetical protein [Planctomycetales bacterium]